MPGGHSHRAGSLRQSNKRNKRTKSSKRSVNRKQGGKIAGGSGGGRSGPKSQHASQAKANRRHVSKQRRDAKKDKLLEARRNLGRVGSTAGGTSGRDGGMLAAGGAPVPRVVGIISLSENEMELEETVQSFIASGADGTHKGGGVHESLPSCVTAKFETHKRDGNLTVLTSSGCFRPQYASKDLEGANVSDAGEGKRQDASINAALDLCRVCDMVIFAVDGTDPAKAIGSTIVDNGPTGMSIGGTDANDASSVATHTTGGANKFDLDDLVSQRGDRILAACKAQGMPTPLTLLVNREASEEEEEEEMMSLATTLKTARRHALRRRNELKRYVSRLATTEFGEDARVTEIDIPAHFGEDEDGMTEMEEDDADKPIFLTKSKKILPDAAATASTAASLIPTRTALIRTLCTISAAPPKWVSETPRPYILADGGVEYNPADRTLQITGYARGMAPLNAHNLVHIPNVGAYGIKSVEDASAKAPFYRVRKGASGGEQRTAIVEADPMKRETLDRFASPDALDGEQNLIGFDEHDDYFDGDSDEEEDKNATTAADGTFKQSADARPAGWSDYQAAWLDAVDDEEDVARDYGELAFTLNKKETASVAGGIDVDMDEANDVTAEERQVLLERRRKDQQEDLEFPDEVEIDDDEKASERFPRYRSLKSFRKSYWDPKENLPDAYGPIFHFSSFRATQGDVMADAKDITEAAATCGRRWWSEDGKTESDVMEDDGDDDEEDKELLEGCVPSGAYITITLEDVPLEAFSRLSPNAVATAVSLLPHENKVSVVHMALSQMTKCEQPDDMPIKSKDVLTFRCGWRTWQSRPIFSQNNLNSDKHKFERYLPTGGAFFAGTVFGPVTYGPCPVLAFREASGASGNSGRRQLVAVGSTLGADAERIVVKRIVLTGYPVRVHKRHATVKYMFYNPDDVKWFKPAGLITKHGLQGNIIESVGEHGTMKCLFNAPIKQHDTVCLPLYKRVYPKYSPVDEEDLLIL